MTDIGLPVQLDLTDAQAHLLRRYKRKVLEALTLKEKLFCNVCNQAGRPDGVRARVTDQSIDIYCRCTNRIYLKGT